MNDAGDQGSQYPIDPNEFDDAFKSADQSAERLHSRLSEGAQYAGYIRKALQLARKIYSALAIKCSEDPELIPIVQGAIDYVRNLAKELNEIEGSVKPSVQRLLVFTSSASSFSSSTGTMVDTDFLESLGESPFIVPPFLARDREEQAKKFDRIDKSLGNTYRGAWEAYHGGKSDPLRSALYLMRQAFDHLFGVLAPDDDVRSSKYFEPKAGKNPSSVHRVERIRYAAYKHIDDKGIADTLASLAPQIKAVYDELNRAHKRGVINSEKATGSLQAMSTFLEDFIGAINLKGA